jgi:hypothetical protein
MASQLPIKFTELVSLTSCGIQVSFIDIAALSNPNHEQILTPGTAGLDRLQLMYIRIRHLCLREAAGRGQRLPRGPDRRPEKWQQRNEEAHQGR